MGDSNAEHGRSFRAAQQSYLRISKINSTVGKIISLLREAKRLFLNPKWYFPVSCTFHNMWQPADFKKCCSFPKTTFQLYFFLPFCLPKKEAKKAPRTPTWSCLLRTGSLTEPVNFRFTPFVDISAHDNFTNEQIDTPGRKLVSVWNFLLLFWVSSKRKEERNPHFPRCIPPPARGPMLLLSVPAFQNPACFRGEPQGRHHSRAFIRKQPHTFSEFHEQAIQKWPRGTACIAVLRRTVENQRIMVSLEFSFASFSLFQDKEKKRVEPRV